jgi:hypothetical protein
MVGVELAGLDSAAVVAAALERDVWIYPAGSGPAVNDGLLLAPPMIIDDRQIDRVVDVTRRAIDAADRRVGPGWPSRRSGPRSVVRVAGLEEPIELGGAHLASDRHDLVAHVDTRSGDWRGLGATPDDLERQGLAGASAMCTMPMQR